MAEFDVRNRSTQQQNEYQRRAEINDALVRMGGAGETQADVANKAAQFTYDDWRANEASRLSRNTRDVEGAGRALKTAAGIALGGMTGGAGGAAIGGLSSLGGYSTEDLSSILEKLSAPEAGMVRISGGVNRRAYVPVAPANYYKKYTT